MNSAPAPEEERPEGLLNQLRARGSRALRAVFAPPAPPVVAPRPWRPPASGHTTSRYAGLAAHPFATAPSETDSDLLPSTMAELDGLQLQQRHGEVVDHSSIIPTAPTSPAAASAPPASRAVSPSQRALQAASGNAVPVTPERARLQTERGRLGHTVALPKDYRQAVNSGRSITAPAAGDLTARTAELLEQFPTPPVAENAVRVKHAPLKRRALSLSLFPRAKAREEDGGVAPLGGSSRSDAVPEQSPLPQECMPSQHREIGRAPYPLIAGGFAPDGSEHGDLSVNRLSITERRDLQTPIEPVVANEGTANLDDIFQPPSRPGTGTSRYFSATSTALGTRAVSQTQRHGSEQLRRAVANGADRFDGRRIPGEHRPSTPVRPTRPQNENNFPITPVTVTRAAKEFCPHKLAKLRAAEAAAHIALTERSSRRLQLDGTSPSPNRRPAGGDETAPVTNVGPVSPQPATPASYLGLPHRPPQALHADRNDPPIPTSHDFATHTQGPVSDPAHPGEPVPAPARGQRDSITSLGAPSSRLHTHVTKHRAHPAYGTWRTRMKRTKCWRCELEARRQSTATFFSRRTSAGGGAARGLTTGDEGDAVGWWGRWCGDLGRCLRWTCFCRYRAYDDGESSSEEDEEEGGREQERRITGERR